MSEKPVGEYVEISGDYEPLLDKQFKPWLSTVDLSERGITLKNFGAQEPIFSLFKFEKEECGSSRGHLGRL